MKITKTTFLLNLVNEYLIDSPAPRNLNYFWNFGSLLGLNLIILLISGISLAMHYTPHISLAFASVEHILRDVNSGWLIRYTHANAASFFFIWVYLHIARGLFYASYKHNPILWIIGVLIFLLMMATAFLGYVLPFGQMSFWGAAVITNLFSVISHDLVLFIWGAFSVENSTLNRFFSLHYLLPLILTAFIILHLASLRQTASSNPDGLQSLADRIPFHPYFTSKDLVGFFLFFLLLSFLLFYFPNLLGHPDNNIPANPLVTPLSIVPEFYFLPFYAILRAIPNKTLGVLLMFASILSLLLLPLSSFFNLSLSKKYLPLSNFFFFIFAFNFLFLLWLGAKPVAHPFIILAQFSTFIYFAFIIFLIFT